jgi:hypothetical protein
MRLATSEASRNLDPASLFHLPDHLSPSLQLWDRKRLKKRGKIRFIGGPGRKSEESLGIGENGATLGGSRIKYFGSLCLQTSQTSPFFSR